MRILIFRRGDLFTFLFLLIVLKVNGNEKPNAQISGTLSIDSTWEQIVYLSHIPSFEDMYVMSNEMIIAKAEIDSDGYFKFNFGYLPKEENLYRLHLVKRGDSPATLIIGGRDENHLFIVANQTSKFQINNHNSKPPFKQVTFENSPINTNFHDISRMVFLADSLASESSAAKRALLEDQLHKDLLIIADTSEIFLVSLYAIYKSKFETNYALSPQLYQSYFKKWKKNDNSYIQSFQNKIPRVEEKQPYLYIVFTLLFISLLLYLFIKRKSKKLNNFSSLSIQERKIFEFLRQGASNQEISDHFNIEISTVKTHVSNIYSKLKVKSRKDILNMK